MKIKICWSLGGLYVKMCGCFVIFVHWWVQSKVIIKLCCWQNYQRYFTFVYNHFQRYKNIWTICIYPGDRILVGARFCAPVQTDSIQWVRVFPGGNAAGVWHWPPTTSSTDVKERVELYLYSPCGHSWPVLEWTLSLLRRTDNCVAWHTLQCMSLYCSSV
jgi:hypothetical protein